MSDGVLVWLVRYVQDRTFARSARLPIAPFPGLGLPIDEDSDPIEVRRVYLNYNGSVVCDMGRIRYTPEELGGGCTPASMVAYHTTGWMEIDEGAEDWLEAPPEPTTRLHRAETDLNYPHPPRIADWPLADVVAMLTNSIRLNDTHAAAALADHIAMRCKEVLRSQKPENPDDLTTA